MKHNKYISNILLVVWCGVIFYLSSQPSSVSGSNSLGVLGHIIFWMDSSELASLNSIFREFMHASVFCILGILAYFSFSKVFVFSLLFCTLYALSDETHQLFVSGRAFELIDLALDFVGSLVGISLAKLGGMLSHD